MIDKMNTFIRYTLLYTTGHFTSRNKKQNLLLREKEKGKKNTYSKIISLAL